MLVTHRLLLHELIEILDIVELGLKVIQLARHTFQMIQVHHKVVDLRYVMAMAVVI